jgi:hypothetical protein
LVSRVPQNGFIWLILVGSCHGFPGAEPTAGFGWSVATAIRKAKTETKTKRKVGRSAGWSGSPERRESIARINQQHVVKPGERRSGDRRRWVTHGVNAAVSLRGHRFRARNVSASKRAGGAS